MASAYNKLTAEQVRANYREQYFVADLKPPTVVSAITGDPDGLIHTDKLGAPLEVEILEWDDRPVSPFQPPDVLTMEFHVAGEWVPIAPAEDIDSAVGFPLDREIPLVIFKDLEGAFQFRYRVKSWNGTERTSLAVPVTIDRTGPIWADPLNAVIEIQEPLITDEVLARDKGVYCIIPAFIEPHPPVLLLVAWLNRVPAPGEDVTQFIVHTQILPPDRKVLIDEQHIKKYGSSTQYAVAFLVDKAGNRGEMSLPATVPVALGTLPSDLKPCTVPLAADGLIDREDAAFPTKVHIERYTGWTMDDGLVVKWGKELARTSVGAHLPFPLQITVPWSHMADEYDFASATHVQSVKVDYTVLRGDHPFPSPNEIDIDTDFAIPGPGNPGIDPAPINPDLDLVVFKSFSGSATELTVADIGKDATASITLFDDPEVDDTLTLYYNGIVVTATNNPYTVDGTETPNEVIEFNIPWTPDIERTLVMNDLPIHYTLTHKDFNNPQESDRTYINVLVEKVDLLEPEFLPPTDFPNGIVNCNSLKPEVAGSADWGIFVHIPKSDHLKEGVDVSLLWETYEVDDATLIPGTHHEDNVIVSADQEANGISWFVPYEKCLKPTYNPPSYSAGMGRVQYAMKVHGNTEKSEEVKIVIGVFESDGGPGNQHCVIPRP